MAHVQPPPATRTGPDSAAWARRWHGGVVAVVAVALVLQLVLVIVAPDAGAPDSVVVRVLRYFSYFTIQSNILVLVVSVTLARNAHRDGPVWRVLRLDAVLAIVLTGIVHYIALRPIQDLDGLSAVADILLHVVSPIIVFVGWLLFGPRPRVGAGDVIWSVVWPLLWFGYTLAHGAIGGWYPYPFIDVDAIGYGRALLNAAIVTVIFLALAAGTRRLDARMHSAPGST